MGLSAGGTYVGLASQIAIQPFSWTSKRIAGKYYNSDISCWGTTANTGTGVDTLCATPFIVSERTSFDRIAIDVNTAQLGSLLRIGIYYDDASTHYPSTLLYGSAALSGGVAGKVEEIIAITLEPGLYWLAVNHDDATNTLEFTSPTSPTIPCVLGNDLTGQGNFGGWQVASIFGAMPATFPAAGGDLVNRCFVFLRVA